MPVDPTLPVAELATALEARSPVPRAVLPALERLALAVRIRELAGLEHPPALSRRPRLSRVAAGLVGVAETDWGLDDPMLDGTRAWLVYAVLVAGLRVASGAFWRLGWRTVGSLARRHAEGHAARTRSVAGYVSASPKEDQVIRLSLLLQILGRREAGVRLLIERVRSARVSVRSRRLLASWLKEVGEAEAATALAAIDEAHDDDVRSRARPHIPVRLRYGVVVLTMFDTDVFRASVRSLLRSDYHGRVVVVEEGNETVEACRVFCESVGVTYIKSPAWSGSAAGMNLGVRQLAGDVDVVLSSHSDVLWPREWFGALDRVWESVWDADRVAVLNLGYLQITSRVDPLLTGLFVDEQYDDLEWVLRAMRDVPAVCDQVQDIQVKPGQAPFGLARDPGGDWMSDLRQQTGRYSVAAAFPVHVWRELGEFDPDLVYALDLQFLHHALECRRWAFFVNTPPVIHLESADIEHLAPEKRSEMGARFLSSTHDRFLAKYGWHAEHFLNVYFSETTVVHHDVIVDAANAHRFDEIDFVFDDFAARLERRTIDNCELVWCRSRAQCPYV
jgi:hypothetical protein